MHIFLESRIGNYWTYTVWAYRWVSSVIISRDGRYIITASFDKDIRVWEMLTGECIRILKGHSRAVKSVCISSNNQYVISSLNDKTIQVWDFKSGMCKMVIEGHINQIQSVTIYHDNRFIISGSKDMTVRVWDINTGVCWQIFKLDSGVTFCWILSQRIIVVGDKRGAVSYLQLNEI